jgi:hypothetical protein
MVLATITSPGYRGIHIGAVFIHSIAIIFWAWQKKKAKNYVPKPTQATEKEFTIAHGKLLFGVSLCFAILFEIFMIWQSGKYFQINQRFEVPITLGNVLTQLSTHVASLSLGYMIIAVAHQALQSARAAAKKPTFLAPETVNAPETRPTWWTQDETRQEIKRNHLS